MFANTNTFKLFNLLKSRLKLIKHDERWDNSSTRTPVFLSAFASANTTPVADFSLMISHEAFCGTRTTATAIGLPVRRSFDCWNSTISVQSTQLNSQKDPTRLLALENDRSIPFTRHWNGVNLRPQRQTNIYSMILLYCFNATFKHSREFTKSCRLESTVCRLTMKTVQCARTRSI